MVITIDHDREAALAHDFAAVRKLAFPKDLPMGIARAVRAP
jgi:hypothetical protein